MQFWIKAAMTHRNFFWRKTRVAKYSPSLSWSHISSWVKLFKIKNDGERYVFLRWEKGAYLSLESEEKELILNSSNAGFFTSGWEWIFPFWHMNHSWASHDDSGLIPPLIWVVIDYIGITSINWCGTKTKKDKIIGLLLHVKICIKLSAEHLHQAFKAPSWAKVWPS